MDTTQGSLHWLDQTLANFFSLAPTGGSWSGFLSKGKVAWVLLQFFFWYLCLDGIEKSFWFLEDWNLEAKTRERLTLLSWEAIPISCLLPTDGLFDCGDKSLY